MSHLEVRSQPSSPTGETAREYLFDMIAQLAKLARGAGEAQVAIHLEAILAARRIALDAARA